MISSQSVKLARRAAQVTSSSSSSSNQVVCIPESAWRPSALHHRERIHKLLKPGLLVQDYKGEIKQEVDGLASGLNPKHPTYNFLIEYYGLKGAKGAKRLARWSPNISLLYQDKDYITDLTTTMDSGSLPTEGRINQDRRAKYRGILLENATPDDVSQGLLYGPGPISQTEEDIGGLLYSPHHYFYNKMAENPLERTWAQLAAPYYWYKSILEQTLSAPPILHCHGLHEWAMQYRPLSKSDKPPSSKYQAHLPLRVSQETINHVVEHGNVCCTHVDALRFFAPEAGKFNSHGYPLTRDHQLKLEQPACLHAQMDLLKMALRLQPHCHADIIHKVLDIALEARQLDVAASPYDASAYGIDAIAIETASGRARYRLWQEEIMQKAQPIRRALYEAYCMVIDTAFCQENNDGTEKRIQNHKKEATI